MTGSSAASPASSLRAAFLFLVGGGVAGTLAKTPPQQSSSSPSAPVFFLALPLALGLVLGLVAAFFEAAVDKAFFFLEADERTSSSSELLPSAENDEADLPDGTGLMAGEGVTGAAAAAFFLDAPRRPVAFGLGVLAMAMAEAPPPSRSGWALLREERPLRPAPPSLSTPKLRRRPNPTVSSMPDTEYLTVTCCRSVLIASSPSAASADGASSSFLW